jgi:hypothetical protein
MRHASVDEGDRVKKGGRAAPFMAARWRGREKGARGPKLKGARAVSCGHAARGGAGGGGVRSAAGPGRDGAGSSSAGTGERRERGPVRGKWLVGWPGEIRKKKKKKWA